MPNILSLELLFSDSPQQFQKLQSEIHDMSVFKSAELLLAEAKGLEVLGTEKLAQPISGSKFVSLLSELRIANIFGRQGYTVEILPDEAFGHKYYTPDILVVTSFGEILVEVTSGSPGGVDMTSLIQEGLTENNLCFRITEYLAEDLSIPGVKAEERSTAEEKARTTASKFIEFLKGLSPLDRGATQIDGTRFEYEPLHAEKGYHSGGVTAFHRIQTEKHIKKLLDVLEIKASKQPKLPTEKREIPFVVAYDNREWELTPFAAHSALTGSRCDFSAPPEEKAKYLNEKRTTYPDDLIAALSGPWKPLLEDWGYGPHSQFYMNDFGALFEKEWAQHLSGVLLTHVQDIIHWLPNPYAAEPLRAPQLLEIQLPTIPSQRSTNQLIHSDTIQFA